MAHFDQVLCSEGPESPRGGLAVLRRNSCEQATDDLGAPCLPAARLGAAGQAATAQDSVRRAATQRYLAADFTSCLVPLAARGARAPPGQWIEIPHRQGWQAAGADWRGSAIPGETMANSASNQQS